MRKYAETDGNAKVLNPELQNEIEKNLHALGKTSAKELTPAERKAALSSKL